MKKFILIFALSIGIASFANTANAQNVNISINIGNQPAWGPVGYDYVNYYYFPDIDCYYDINQGMFVYYNRGRWMSARYLPSRYRNYDLYVLHKVIINDLSPWRYNYSHRTQYSRYRGYHGQTVIRDSRDNRYRNSRSNNVSWYSSDRNNSRPTAVSNSRPSNNSNNRPNVNSNNSRPQNTTRPTNNATQTTRPNRESSNSNRENTTRPTSNTTQTTRPNRESSNSNRENTTNSRPSSVQNTDRSSRNTSTSDSASRTTSRTSSRNVQNSSAR